MVAYNATIFNKTKYTKNQQFDYTEKILNKKAEKRKPYVKSM